MTPVGGIFTSRDSFLDMFFKKKSARGTRNRRGVGFSVGFGYSVSLAVRKSTGEKE